MKKFIQIASVLLLLGALTTACSNKEEEPKNPTTQPTNNSENPNKEDPNNNDTPADVKLESLAFDAEEYTVIVGSTRQLKAIATPKEWKGTLKWESNNPDFVSVDANGIVKGVTLGDAYITVSAEGKAASCKVTVVKPERYDLELKPEIQAINKGDEGEMYLTCDGSVYDKEFPVEWISSDPEVLTIDKEGHFVGKSFGSVAVVAKVLNGDPENVARCYVTVEDNSLPNVFDESKLCGYPPFPYLESPTTEERIQAAERHVRANNVSLRKFAGREGNILTFVLRDFLGFTPPAFFGWVEYDLKPGKDKPFAIAYAEGVTDDRLITVLQQDLNQIDFKTLKKIKIYEEKIGYRSENKEGTQSVLIYTKPNPRNPDKLMGVLEFRTLDNDPYKN